jgi:hypothetical protein
LRRGLRARIAVAVTATALLVSGLIAPLATAPAQAADLSQFNAGNIVSDAVFFDAGAMSQAQIQSFLQSKEPTCAPSGTCVKDYYAVTKSVAADAMCGAYSGGTSERASAIVYKVAQACGINPQVLLVTMQKEQGLITSVWPSDWAYAHAMGADCPDTTGCNSISAGFFAQVYKSAWQFKRYANPPGTSTYFTWYAPGKTWNIQYNPNTACGTKSVYVQNQATADLYYYTPYTPNAAALAAGYGTGDSCSAYGNRNFYNYFTDWFGSTQRANVKLIKNGDPIYLVDGTRLYHITAADYPEFLKAFGAPVTVSADYVAVFTAAGDASRIIRNESTGAISWLQDGSTHHFTTCAQVSAWGSGCTTAVNLTAATFNSVPVGPEITSFLQVEGRQGIFQLTGTSLLPVYDAATAAAINGGTQPYAATMPATTAAALKVGLTLFAPARFISLDSAPRVYLPTTDGQLIYLPSWTNAAEYGLPTAIFSQGVPAAATTGYSPTTTLNMFAACGSTTYYASRGTLYPVTSQAATGFAVPAFDAATCNALKLSTAAPLSTIFVQGVGQQEIYLAQNGVYRHVTSPAALLSLTGGVPPTVLSLSASTVAGLPMGADYSLPLKAGMFVGSASSPRVYLVTGDSRLIYLPSWAIASEFGLPSVVASTISDAQLAAYKMDGTLGLFATCASTTYHASRGTLVPVSAAAATGFTVSTLDPATCGLLRLSTAAPLPAVFVQGTGQPEVYLAQNGVYRHVATPAVLLRLGGGTSPVILPLSPATIAVLPMGSAITQ